MFLAANIGDLAGHGPIENAMAFAQQPVFTASPRQPGPCLAERQWRKPSDPRQERRPKQHLDLHRVRSAAQARHCYSPEPRQTAAHYERAANLARARARKIRAIQRRRTGTGYRLMSRSEAEKTALLRSFSEQLTLKNLPPSATAFHCGRLQRLRGLHRSPVAAAPFG